MASEDRLRKLHLFLDFYFAPWGAAKAARWEHLTKDSELNKGFAELTARRILGGMDDLNWEALDGWNSNAQPADQTEH